MSRITRKFSSFSQRDISELLKNARVRVRIPGLRILTAPAALPDRGRVLVITPRHSGNAPQRNLIRRRIKSVFFEDGLYKKNLDFVIVVRSEAIGTSFGELKKLLHRACNSS